MADMPFIPAPGEPPSQRFINAVKIIGSGVLSWVILPLVMILVLHTFVFQAYHVEGTSMLHTLQNRDYLIVSKIGDSVAQFRHAFNKNVVYLPARGQIIVFHYPIDPTQIFVKRVIGLPGDHVVVRNGTVTVYTESRPKGYNPDATYEFSGTQTLEDTDITVTSGHVFVMGDNRAPGGSFDSRAWGQLPSENIIGNAVMRLLPLGQSRIF